MAPASDPDGGPAASGGNGHRNAKGPRRRSEFDRTQPRLRYGDVLGSDCFAEPSRTRANVLINSETDPGEHQEPTDTPTARSLSQTEVRLSIWRGPNHEPIARMTSIPAIQNTVGIQPTSPYFGNEVTP